jgi:hypothetical protein
VLVEAPPGGGGGESDDTPLELLARVGTDCTGYVHSGYGSAA